MKKYKILLIMFFAFISFNQVQSQVRVNINLTPQYYYYPDVESYYDIQNESYIYSDNGVWVRSQYLPYRYRNYNLNNRVILDYRGNRPYDNYQRDRNYSHRDYNRPQQRNRQHREYRHDNGNHGNKHDRR